MMLFQKITNWRWLPQRFFPQILFFVGVTVLVASVFVGGLFTYESIHRTRNQIDDEIVFLSQNIAAMSGMPILNEDNEFLDEILKMNAQFSFVDSIVIVDSQNRVLSQVIKNNGNIQTVKTIDELVPKNYDESFDLDPPHNSISRLINSLVPPNTVMEVWHPIQAGKLLGSIRIRYSQKEFREEIVRLWQHAFFYAAVAVVLISILLYAMLRLPMRTLFETAKFANALNSNIGTQIQVYSGTKEFNDLTVALNHLSLKLKTQQMALAKSAAHNQAILDNVADGIFSLDAEGNILSFNLAAKKMFAGGDHYLVGSPIKSLLLSQQDSADAANEISEFHFLRAGTREVTGVRQDNSRFPIEISITESDGSHDFAYICIARDITERHRLNRLKSEFVSTVSHELRTPLTSISGSLKIIDSGVVGELPAKVKELIGVAVKNSQRLIVLINDLLDMEKLAAGKMVLNIAPVNLISNIESAITGTAAYAANYSVTFKYLPSHEDVQVMADPQRLTQVVVNILSNAAKFSNGSPFVEVRTSVDPPFARVEIEDHGAGIPADFRKEIFGAFAQANSGNTRQQGGSGLGLKISKALINDMGGEIGFTTEEGKGTIFWFTLPLPKNLS